MSFLSDIGKTWANKANKKMKNNLLSVLKSRLGSFGAALPIGCFGGIAFEVSSSKVETFDNYKRETKARYAAHDVMNSVPIQEFLGPDGETISFTMNFNQFWGVEPTTEVNKIREMCRKGQAEYFILNNSPVGDNKWVIESVSEAAEAWDNMGNIILSSINVTLREYVEDLPE